MQSSPGGIDLRTHLCDLLLDGVEGRERLVEGLPLCGVTVGSGQCGNMKDGGGEGKVIVWRIGSDRKDALE